MRLQKTATIIQQTYKGLIPSTQEELTTLPGVGIYTAGAVRVFAYDLPEVIIETNIRTVFLEEFFTSVKRKITDEEIAHVIKAVLPRENFRDWYNALMDYGASLKHSGVSHNNTYKNISTTHQSFKGSSRQTRGAIVKALLEKNMTKKELVIATHISVEKITLSLHALVKEKTVLRKKNIYLI